MKSGWNKNEKWTQTSTQKTRSTETQKWSKYQSLNTILHICEYCTLHYYKKHSSLKIQN